MAINPEEATSLKAMFQGLIPEQFGVIQGTVTATSPLKIQAVNDDKLTIGANILIVPQHLTDYTVEMTVNHSTNDETAHVHTYKGTTATGGADPHTHDYSNSTSPTTHRHGYTGRKSFLVHSALAVGDKVHLLSLNNGKQYFVLGRVV